MKIALFGKTVQDSFFYYMEEMLRVLAERKITLSCYRPFYLYLKEHGNISPVFSTLFDDHVPLEKDTDVLLSIGGDGTFLQAVTRVKESGIPILGINCGRMGFLANVAQEEVGQAMALLSERCYEIEQRDLLHLQVQENPFADFSYALNDITVQKTEYSSLINIHAFVGEEYLTSYWSDGLIVSTPTGSTAYSLSEGGAIVAPACETLIITPVSPHNLNMRSLVLPKKEKIRLQVESRSGEYMLSVDSRICKMPNSREICISSPDFSLNVVKLPTHGYYDTLRNKLGWGEDKRNAKMWK